MQLTKEQLDKAYLEKEFGEAISDYGVNPNGSIYVILKKSKLGRIMPVEYYQPELPVTFDRTDDTSILLAKNGNKIFLVRQNNLNGERLDVICNKKAVKRFDKYLDHATYVFVDEYTINNWHKAQKKFDLYK